MIVGLTGSIAMGKTTTAKMFEKLGCPVFDADKAVHGLYQQDGRAALEIAKIFPDVMNNGTVDRSTLAAKIALDKTVLPRIEQIVHPLVHKLEKEFISHNIDAGTEIVLLDIPLLFEAGRTKDVDIIVVVSTTIEQQRMRALQRPGMTLEKFNLILSRQLPDKEKCAKADYVIDTGKSLEETFNQVEDLVRKLTLQNRQLEN